MRERMEMAMLFVFLGLAAYYDCRWKRIPWSVLGMGAIFMIICLIVEHAQDGVGILLALIPGTCLLLLAWVTGENIGYGDGIGVLLLGGIAGFRNCIWALCFSLFLLSVAGIILLGLKKAKRGTKLPYIPFLLAAEGILNVFHIV